MDPGGSARPRRRRIDPRHWVAVLAAVGWPSPRKVVRIARWEVSRTATTLDRRTLLVLVAGAVIAAVVAPSLASGGVTLESGIYRVGIDEDSRYYPVVADNPQFVAGDPSTNALQEGRIDVLVRGSQVRYHRSQKGRAAYSAFRSAVQNYNDRLMIREVETGGDESAAFPVAVVLRYDSRVLVDGTSGGSGGGGGGGGSGGGGGGIGDGGGGSDGGPVQVPNLGGGSGLTVGAQGSPSDIQPPFPFGSLVLAFLFIIPMNFVIQSYGSTIMEERLNRRGELLLVAPVTRADIVVGKTLPYFGTLLGITVAITLGLNFLVADGSGAGLLSIAAVLPLAMLFLSASFVGAMFARSFKELTFVTLAISVFLTSYAFVPAIFTEITPIALISPLTLVVRDLQGGGATAPEFAFSTGPLLFSSLMLFALGAGVYREEDMFTQRSVPLKALDAMAAWIRGKWSVGALTAAFIPFVFVAELLAIALLFALPIVVSISLLLLTIAFIEEVAKSAHVYAGFEHGRYGRGLRSAVTVGAFSGLGFFVGEKLFLVVQVVGLQTLPIGQAAFPQAQALPLPVALALLFAPLALHTVTAAITAVGASRSKYAYAGTLVVATFVHLAYNLGVVVFAR